MSELDRNYHVPQHVAPPTQLEADAILIYDYDLPPTSASCAPFQPDDGLVTPTLRRNPIDRFLNRVGWRIYLWLANKIGAYGE